MTSPSSESPDLVEIAKAVLEGTQASVSGSLVERMEITIDEVTPERIVGSMPATPSRTDCSTAAQARCLPRPSDQSARQCTVQRSASCPLALSCPAPTIEQRAVVEFVELPHLCQSVARWQPGRSK